jgi:integrase
VEEGTLDKYTDTLDFHILPFMGSTPIDQIRTVDVQAYVNTQVRKKATVETVRTRFQVLRTMLRDAVSQLELSRDPTLRIIVPEREERDDGNRLTAEQLGVWLATFLAAAPFHYAYALTMALSGMRPCHVGALRWEDVDLEAGVLRPRLKVYSGKISAISKKKRAPKEFPIPDELVEVLKAHRAWLNAPMKTYHRGDVLRHPGVASGLCFPSLTGTPLRQGNVSRYWQDANAAVGVTINARGLRRTFNDLLERAKINAHTAEALTAQTPGVRKLYMGRASMDDKRAAVGQVLQLVRQEKK